MKTTKARSATRDEHNKLSADLVPIPISAARDLGRAALRNTNYSGNEIEIIIDHLIDADLCGYRGSGLAKILPILSYPMTWEPRTPFTIVHETEISALIDGGNMVGYIPVQHATQLAIKKARAHRMAIVGVFNAYFSGRNAYYLEQIAKADMIGIHTCSSEPFVVPIGGMVPALGTNPIAFGMPSDDGTVIFDIGTAAMRFGETAVRQHLNEELPDGAAIDATGRPTRNAREALAGGLLPFGGHRGYVLSFAVQALGLLAGAARPRGKVQDYGFLFLVFDPALLVPTSEFKQQMSELVQKIKATPRQPGVNEIRVPSERAFGERERRMAEGTVLLERKVYESLRAV